MARGGLNAEAVSGRQTAVAAVLAGLSPCVALAGRGQWLWVLIWSAAGAVLVWLALRRTRGRRLGLWLRGAYCVWAVILAARVLERTSTRLEITSGGSPRFWLLLIVAVPLLWMSWGRAASFFRMAEILWLVMAVVVALALIFGAVRVEWRYVIPWTGGVWDSLLLASEVMTPVLFTIPYIYKVKELHVRRNLAWLSLLAVVTAGVSLVTAGILGGMGEELTLPFFTAAGALGKTARCEGLLSVLWLLPDLTLAGLLCRVWGARRWPALAAGLAAALSLCGISEIFAAEICLIGTLALLILTLCCPGREEK